MLSDSESDEQSLHLLTINEHYAKAFEYKKEREELAKLQEKYGSDPGEDDDDDDESESDSESEDEDGEELTATVDAAILRTLAKIKRKDPDIYNSEKGVFQEEQKRIAPNTVVSARHRDKSKPVTMRQVVLESALHPTSRSPSPQLVPRVEEQRELRDETIAAFHNAVEGELGDDTLLIPREKSKDEIEREEEEYRVFLEREVGDDLQTLITVDPDTVGVRETVEVKEKQKRKLKNADKHESDHEFLMNYILNRGWIDRSSRHVPTYGEVTRTSSDKGKGDHDQASCSGDGGVNDEEEFDEDQFEEIADAFETSYNFRFEEPDGALVKSYPRNLPSLVRREDTSRREARDRKRLRKEEELLKKKEEVKRLKALKMKEIRAKLERIGEEGGKNVDDSKALQDLDLDADWNPDAHDEQMAQIYGNDEDPADAEKPQWDDDIDISDILPREIPEPAKKKKKKKKQGGVDDVEEGVDVDKMDADVEPVEDEEEWDGSEEMRKKMSQKYMDEVYGLEFNDVVGGIPTRFKYTPVQPQSFALNPAEILMATDTELNQYLSVKKYAPYRKEGRWDQSRGQRLQELKQALMGRGANWAGAEVERSTKKRRGKKERMKAKEELISEPVAPSGDAGEPTDAKAASNDKRKRQDSTEGDGGGRRKRTRQKKRRDTVDLA